VSDSELWAQYAASRDPQTRDALVLRYVPLVHYILNRLGITSAIGPNYEDLAGQGLLGLIEAVDRYDTGHGAQFSTYAAVRIRGRVLDQLRSQDLLSRSARRRARNLQAAMAKLSSELRRVPTDEELAEHLGLSLAQLRQSLAESDRVLISLDTMGNGDDEEGTLHELVADESEENGDPADLVAESELKQRLAGALRELPEREQLVLSLYYYEELTLKEIGAVLDLSESRVCQLHARAVMSLRSILASQEEPAEAEPVQPPSRRSLNMARGAAMSAA
jgi:RNA polymerase sigma factor FliA